MAIIRIAISIGLAIIYSTLVVISGCKNRSEQKENIPNGSRPNKNLQTDSIAISYEDPPVHLQKMCWDARWRQYCMYCDSPVRIPGIESLTYGELELHAWFESDSVSHHYRVSEPIYQVSLDFTYKYKPMDYYIYEYLKDTVAEIAEYHFRQCIINGLDYLRKNQELPLGFRIDRTHRGTMLDSIEVKFQPKKLREFRINNPMQPEVIYYIRENQTKINPWFYAEAKRRGVFDSVKYPPEKISTEIVANKKEKNKIKDWRKYFPNY